MTIFTRIILSNEFGKTLFGATIGNFMASGGIAGFLSYKNGLETDKILKDTIIFGFLGASAFITSPIWMPYVIYDTIKKKI